MGLDRHGDVQVARGTAPHAGLALATLDQAHAVLDARRDAQLEAALAPHAAGAAAALAAVLMILLAVAGGTGATVTMKPPAWPGPEPLQVGQVWGWAGLGALSAAGVAVFVAEEIDCLSQPKAASSKVMVMRCWRSLPCTGPARRLELPMPPKKVSKIVSKPPMPKPLKLAARAAAHLRSVSRRTGCGACASLDRLRPRWPR